MEELSSDVHYWSSKDAGCYLYSIALSGMQTFLLLCDSTGVWNLSDVRQNRPLFPVKNRRRFCEDPGSRDQRTLSYIAATTHSYVGHLAIPFTSCFQEVLACAGTG